MVKKRVVKKYSKSKISFEKQIENGIKNFDKEVDKEVFEVEKWVIERRKFFRKLGFLIVLIIALIIFSIALMKLASGIN